LMIPDLSQMQVKVGIHEAFVDRVKPGMPARIKLQDETLDGEVLSVASVTRPAGWWNGNQVKYDTVIRLNSPQGLKPGMSASVEILLAHYDNVLRIPVAAVVQQEGRYFCWVRTEQGTRRRELKLGDSNDQFMIVEDGLREGDEVVLNPRAFLTDAQADALQPVDRRRTEKTPKSAKKKSLGGPDAIPTENKSPGKAAPSVASILKQADKNGDGLLSKDEIAAKDRPSFDKIDANGDGKVDLKELGAAVKKRKPKPGAMQP